MKTKKLFTAAALPICIAMAGAGSLAYATSASGQVAADAPVKFTVPAGTYELDATHTSFLWSLPHMGLSQYTARFDTVQGNLAFDPANPTKSKLELTIDPKSVNANFPAAMYKSFFGQNGYTGWSDEIANSPNYLNAKAHPAITFKSTSVKQTGARTGLVTGDLSFRGVTKPVTLTVRFNGDLAKHPLLQRSVVGFGAEGVIKRSDFGVAPNLPAFAVGDEVTIRFEGEFIQKQAAAAGAQ